MLVHYDSFLKYRNMKLFVHHTIYTVPVVCLESPCHLYALCITKLSATHCLMLLTCFCFILIIPFTSTYMTMVFDFVAQVPQLWLQFLHCVMLKGHLRVNPDPTLSLCVCTTNQSDSKLRNNWGHPEIDQIHTITSKEYPVNCILGTLKFRNFTSHPWQALFSKPPFIFMPSAEVCLQSRNVPVNI